MENKTLIQMLADAVVGRKIRVWKAEFKEYEYEQYQSRPSFHYDADFYRDGAKSVECEIVGLTMTDKQKYKIRIVMNDEGEQAVLWLTVFNKTLQFI